MDTKLKLDRTIGDKKATQRKVVKHPVKVQKKSFGEKARETFIAEDMKSVASTVVEDSIIPALKNLIFDSLKMGLERLLWSDNSPQTTKTSKNGYVSYNNFSSNNRSEVVHRRRGDVNNIILSSKSDADEVLNTLNDQIIDFGVASVADLYELVGVIGTFSDNNFGWTNLSSATINRTRDGWVIKFPKPEVIDR